MSYEYIEIGGAPCDEDCAQMGTSNFEERCHKECLAYKHQLIRILEKEFGSLVDLGEPVSIVIRRHPHDFGTYREVAIKFDTDNEKSNEMAFWLDENCPANWDDAAKEELGLSEETLEN